MDFFKETLSQKDFHIRSNAYLLCESADNQQIFKKEKSASLSTFIRNINNNLSHPKGNLKLAIAKLLTLLPQCPQNVLSTEGEKWIRLCSQRLSWPEVNVTKALLTVITFLLRSCHENKELLNKVEKMKVNFIEKLYSMDAEVRECAFDCLYEMLRLFPSQTLPHKKKIEEKLIPILSLPLTVRHTSLVYSAAKVFAAIPVPGGASSAAEVKGSHLDQLISLSHCAADALFQSVQEIETYDFSRDHKLPDKSLESVEELNDPIVRLLKSAPLLGNCLVFLKGFLEKCTFPFVIVKAKEMVRLAFRILQVEVSMLRESASVELTALSFILPSMHMRAVGFLKTLIENNVCGLFMNLVEEQLVSTLKASSPVAAPKSKPGNAPQNPSVQQNTSLKILCYETLAQAIKVSKGNHKGLLEGLLKNLLDDILPVKDSLSLKSAIRGGQLSLINVKKKSKKKGYTVTSDDSQTNQCDLFSAQIIHQRIPLTVAALDLVETLFIYAHHSNPLKYIKILHDHLMNLLNTSKIGVYKNPHVRKSLFAAINAYALYPHPMCSPAYSMIVEALQREAEDSHPMVTEVCVRGLSTLAFITSNPNTVNWSDIVGLKKDCASVNLNDENEEPVLNGLDKSEDEDADEDEDLERKEGLNEHENNVNEDETMDSEDDDDDGHPANDVVESEDDDGHPANDVVENGVEHSEVEEDEMEHDEAPESDQDALDEDEIIEHDVEDEDGDSTGGVSDSLESEDDEETQIEEGEDSRAENDKGSSLLEDGSCEEEREEDEGTLPPLLDPPSKKRRSKTSEFGTSITKRKKNDQEEVSSSVCEMLSSIMAADPDTDSD